MYSRSTLVLPRPEVPHFSGAGKATMLLSPNTTPEKANEEFALEINVKHTVV